MTFSILHRPDWHIPESEITPESVFLNRRAFMQAAPASLALGALALYAPSAFAAQPPDETLGLYPAARNDLYKPGRTITPVEVTSKYNNFYEFGSHKRISRAAQKLPVRPWEITIDGAVAKPFTLGIDELVKKMQLEERVYRHRCVERWAMTVPWTGFAFADLVKLAQPTARARYVVMETFLNPKIARGQLQTWYPWPYKEGLTVAEANNDLAFLVTGIYGKPLLKQFGAPLRLAVPWKYGFKSIKSITRFTFTDKQPVSFWEKIQPREYGFWANVNPRVPHRRWSQASEELIGTGKRVPTKLFNGYGAQVASLYQGKEEEAIWY